MATAAAATTSTAKAVSGLARERFVDSGRLVFPVELDFASLERFMPFEYSFRWG
jgi:hypothetical protein